MKSVFGPQAPTSRIRNAIGYVVGSLAVLAVIAFVVMFAVSAVNEYDARIHVYTSTSTH